MSVVDFVSDVIVAVGKEEGSSLGSSPAAPTASLLVSLLRAASPNTPEPEADHVPRPLPPLRRTHVDAALALSERRV